jgi:glutathione synthase/RimK-type ligase-like ATP-grasp enzyme
VDVAVVSSAGLADLNEDDRLLVDALRRRGARAEALPWREGGVDWGRVETAVLRSTWDYSERLDSFLQWVDDIAAHTRVLNPPDVVRWNTDKRYLAELERKGAGVVPTRWLSAGADARLEDVLGDAGWGQAVIKPAVSATARDTYRVDAGDLEWHAAEFARLLSTRDMMVQPFLERVASDGEFSLVYIDGEYSHAVAKRPRPGDFRVQEHHGGSLARIEPGARERGAADEILSMCSGELSYARVDLIPDGGGAPLLIELELVEPELFLRCEPASVERLAALVWR